MIYFFTGYSKTVDGGDNPKYRGVLDREKVDKTEEYEVVYFCNQFLSKYKVPQTKESFQKVERLLHNKELKQEDSRANLIKWIANNWNQIS
ncbi:hypothetical protein D3C85_738210 [compost metagenome]